MPKKEYSAMRLTPDTHRRINKWIQRIGGTRTDIVEKAVAVFDEVLEHGLEAVKKKEAAATRRKKGGGK